MKKIRFNHRLLRFPFKCSNVPHATVLTLPYHYIVKKNCFVCIKPKKSVRGEELPNPHQLNFTSHMYRNYSQTERILESLTQTLKMAGVRIEENNGRVCFNISAKGQTVYYTLWFMKFRNLVGLFCQEPLCTEVEENIHAIDQTLHTLFSTYGVPPSPA